MVAPKYRSRSMKRVAVKTPSGGHTLHFKRKRAKRITFRLCGTQLGGVKNSRRVSKSKKIPSRMFAGELCAGCTSELVSLKARIGIGAAAPSDAKLAQQKYLRMMK